MKATTAFIVHNPLKMRFLKSALLLFGISVAGIAEAQPIPVLDTVAKDFVARRNYGLIELQAVQTGDHIPFWMRALQYGNKPLTGTSLAAIVSYVKDYNPVRRRFDWGYGAQVRGNLGSTANATLLEAYAKVRFNPFEIKVGRFRQVQGLIDTALGMGSFSYSGNSLPIPMIQVNLPDYSFPLFDSLISFKGSLAQGWMGDTRTKYMNNFKTLPEYFHQKSLHMRIGKPEAKMRAVLGFVHEAMWVDNQQMIGPSVYQLSPFETFMYIFTGKNYLYKPGNPLTTNIGNHVGHIDVGLEFTRPTTETRVYREFLYDTENSFTRGSLADGITGFSVVNRKPADGGMYLRRFTMEYLSTMNQAYNPARPYNLDNYYNHEFLYDGASYKGTGIGSPFIPMRTEIRSSFPTQSVIIISFNNTRVRALHMGLEWAYDKVLVRHRMSYSRNYGMYETSATFPVSNQFSTSVEVGVPLREGWQARALFALDSGGLLYNSAGGFISMLRLF
jgi:hypothetical protein